MPLGVPCWQEGDTLELDGLLLTVSIPKACEHTLKTATYQSLCTIKPVAWHPV